MPRFIRKTNYFILDGWTISWSFSRNMTTIQGRFLQMIPQNFVCFFGGVGYKTIGLGNRYGFSQERKGVGASIGMLTLNLAVIDTVGAQAGWCARF